MKFFKRIYDSFHSVFILLLLFIVLPGILVLGCGKKGPPEMIEKSREKLKPVTNLQYQLNNNTIQLTWESDDTHPVDGFEIFMAKQDLEKCKDCPVVFVKVDFVESGVNQYQKELSIGYRYFVKVITSGVDDTKSSDSEIIKIEIQ